MRAAILLFGCWCAAPSGCGAVPAAALASSSSQWQARRAILEKALLTSPPDTTPLQTAPLVPFDRMGTARKDVTPLPQAAIASPLPEDYITDVSSLPAEWDWRSVVMTAGADPVHMTSRLRNQFLPYWCGSCWAHAATAVLGSRWLIHIGAQNSGIDFSVQFLINCVVNASRGCHGGSSYEAFALAHSTGIVDSSCLPYRAYNQNCTALDTCEQNLDGHHPKIVAAPPLRYSVGEYGVISAPDKEAAMLKEIYARGPVAACMACPAEFEAYTGGIFATTNNRTVCDHIVTVIGFGGEGASAHWLVQNSFGSTWSVCACECAGLGSVVRRFSWRLSVFIIFTSPHANRGEGGYFRIKRSSALQGHEHNLGIERAVSWAMPRNPSPSP
jgi:cathepsin X